MKARGAMAAIPGLIKYETANNPIHITKIRYALQFPELSIVSKTVRITNTSEKRIVILEKADKIDNPGKLPIDDITPVITFQFSINASNRILLSSSFKLIIKIYFLTRAFQRNTVYCNIQIHYRTIYAMIISAVASIT